MSELLELYGNDSTAARRAVLRQLRLVNESLARLDALPPHPTVDDLHAAVARDDWSSSAVAGDANVNSTPVRPPPTRLRPPTAGGWLPPLLHRHRRWTGNCVQQSATKLTAWLAEPGKQVELPCVTW